MIHPLVTQLRFARSEFLRGLEGVTDEEGAKRFAAMNCIAWNVGHLAWQEQRYWLQRGQGILPWPDIQQQFAYGAPACAPTLSEIIEQWRSITAATDPWLNDITTAKLQESAVYIEQENLHITFGNLILRMTYHYWYHNGENQAIRQMLGHTNLPEYVGDIDVEAPYEPHPA